MTAKISQLYTCIIRIVKVFVIEIWMHGWVGGWIDDNCG